MEIPMRHGSEYLYLCQLSVRKEPVESIYVNHRCKLSRTWLHLRIPAKRLFTNSTQRKMHYLRHLSSYLYCNPYRDQILPIRWPERCAYSAHTISCPRP